MIIKQMAIVGLHVLLYFTLVLTTSLLTTVILSSTTSSLIPLPRPFVTPSLASPSLASHDEKTQAYEALTGVTPPKPQKENLDGSDDIIERLRTEALAELRDSPQLAPLASDHDINEVIRKALDEEFEKAAAKIKEAGDELRRKNAEEIMGAGRDGELRRLIDEDEKRLKEGEEKVGILVNRVEKEKDAVAVAMKELEEAKRNLEGGEGDPLMRLADFRGQSIDKQIAFTAFLLFGARSLSALLGAAVSGGAGAMPFAAVLVQATVALLAGVYFFS